MFVWNCRHLGRQIFDATIIPFQFHLYVFLYFYDSNAFLKLICKIYTCLLGIICMYVYVKDIVKTRKTFLIINSLVKNLLNISLKAYLVVEERIFIYYIESDRNTNSHTYIDIQSLQNTLRQNILLKRKYNYKINKI